MGARYLMCSGVADQKSMAGYEQSAEVFNRVGRRCREAGIDFCYHNHNWEFTSFDGVAVIGGAFTQKQANALAAAARLANGR